MRNTDAGGPGYLSRWFSRGSTFMLIGQGPKLYRPAQRLLVLEASVAMDEAGAYRVVPRNHDVLGIASLLVDNEIVLSPVFVLEGEITTLLEARQSTWGPCTVDDVIACDWPKHCDHKMLAAHLHRMMD